MHNNVIVSEEVIVKKRIIRNGMFVTSGGAQLCVHKNGKRKVRLISDDDAQFYGPETLRELATFLNELADVLDEN